MQTKKRAKSIKFGDKKGTVKKSEKEHSPQEEKHKEQAESIAKQEKSVPESESPQEEVNVEEKINELGSDDASPKDLDQNDTESVTAEIENPDTEITITVENDAKEKNEETLLANEPDQEINVQTPSLGSDTYIVETETRKSMLGYFFLVAVIAFVVGLISMAAFTMYFPKSNGLGGVGSSVSLTATPKPNPTKSPTPAPKAVDLAKYSIKIFNGSGVTGAASKLKDSLTGQGFKVIDTGNADTSDFTDTVVEVKKDLEPAYLAKLNAVLKKEYSVAPVSKMSSDSTTEADVIITIGSTVK